MSFSNRFLRCFWLPLGLCLLLLPSCIRVNGCTDPEALNYLQDATHDDNSCVYNQAPVLVLFSPDTVIFQRDSPITFDLTASDDNSLTGASVAITKNGQWVTTNSASLDGVEDRFSFSFLIHPSVPVVNPRPWVDQPDDAYGEYEVEISLYDDEGGITTELRAFAVLDTAAPTITNDSLDLLIAPNENVSISVSLFDEGGLVRASLSLWRLDNNDQLLDLQETIELPIPTQTVGEDYYLKQLFQLHDLQDGDRYRAVIEATDRFGSKAIKNTKIGRCEA